MAEQSVEAGFEGRVADASVSEMGTDDGAVFLFDVGVAVLVAWKRATEMGVGPFPIEVTVDDGIEEFVSVVGVEPFGWGGMGGEVGFEGGEVMGGAEIEAGASLNPLEAPVDGGGDPEEVTGKIAAAEGHTVGLDVSGRDFVCGTVLAGLDGDKGTDGVLAGTFIARLGPDRIGARLPPDGPGDSRGTHAQDAFRNVLRDMVKLLIVAQKARQAGVQVRRTRAAKLSPEGTNDLDFRVSIRPPTPFSTLENDAAC